MNKLVFVGEVENAKDKEGKFEGINLNTFGEEGKENEVAKEKASDAQIDKTGVYNIKDSRIGDSWLLGKDYFDNSNSATYANAYVNGMSACTENIITPSTLTDKSGKTKLVEIIGQGAYAWCSDYNRGKAKGIKVSKHVKIIKERAFAGMHTLESFEFEAGSVLETIEEHGLSAIGYSTGQSLGKRNATLILPYTLSSVHIDGILNCNIFHTVIYCGSHFLSNYSKLEDGVSPNTTVMVTSRYPKGQKIFERSPNRNSQTETEAEGECMKMNFLPVQTPNSLSLCSPLKYPSLFALAATLLPSSSLPSHSLKTFSPSLSFFVPFT